MKNNIAVSVHHRLLHLAGQIAALTGWRANLLALGFGAIGVLGQAPFHFWPAAVLGLVVLVLLLDSAFAGAKPVRTGAIRAFCFAYGQFFAGLYWIGSAFISRGPEYIPLMPFALAFLMAGLALIWALAGAVAMWCWCQDSRRIAVFALAFFAAEWVRGNFLTGFPWNLPGMVWTPGGAVSQSVALFGIWGLSLLTLFAFASPVLFLGRQRLSWKQAKPASISLVVFSALFLTGTIRLANAEIGEQPGVRLRVVQAVINQREKWQFENRDAILEHYLKLSTAAPMGAVSHVIWPEGALPTLLLEDGHALKRISTVFKDGPVLITGLTRRERTMSGDTLYRNSLIALSFAGGQPRVETVYDKHHLVPFGEYMPLGRIFLKLGIKGLINLEGEFTPGPVPSSVKIANLPVFSPQICYEIAFSGFTPRGEGRPAWILNISNDAWFGATSGPYQHLDHARFRAIEEGLPVVRSASSGIAGVIDPYGHMRLRLGRTADRASDTALPLPLPPTFYKRFGTFALLLLIGGLILFRILKV